MPVIKTLTHEDGIKEGHAVDVCYSDVTNFYFGVVRKCYGTMDVIRHVTPRSRNIVDAKISALRYLDTH